MWCIGGRNPADFCSFFVCRKVTNSLQPNRKPFGCDWHGVLGFSLGHVWLNIIYVSVGLLSFVSAGYSLILWSKKRMKNGLT